MNAVKIIFEDLSFWFWLQFEEVLFNMTVYREVVFLIIHFPF